MRLVLGAFHIGTIGSFHNNARTCGNMRGHHGAEAIGQDGGLEGGRRRLVLDGGFGFGDLKRYAWRQFDGNGAIVEEGDLAFHAFLQEGCGVAQHVGGDVDLLEAFGVHEDVLFAVLIKIGVADGLDEGAFHGVSGFETDDGFHAVRNAAHVDGGRRRALAGVHGFGFEDNV